jgi:hypothetical protein
MQQQSAAAPAPEHAEAQGTGEDPLVTIAKRAELRDQGIVTVEEITAEKEQLLGI